MEAKKIKIIKDWLKLKSIRNIQIFLSFANFYQKFIQDYSKITALFISILKTTRLSNKPAFWKNNNNKLAFNKNNNIMPTSEKNHNDNEFDRFGDDGIKYTKKLEKLNGQKLFKSRKSKDEKLKKLSKIRNFLKFDSKKSGSNILTFGAKKTFNRL